jgi:hypothetical protein
MATLRALQDANVAAEREAEALRSQVRDLQTQLDEYSSSVSHQSKARQHGASGNSRDQVVAMWEYLRSLRFWLGCLLLYMSCDFAFEIFPLT